MNKLDLLEFFYELKDEKYCIVKGNDIITYTPGSDIDIFCYHMDSFVDKILSIGNKYVQEGFFEIKLTRKSNGNHIYVDFIKSEKIEFRFDLYQAMPSYKKIKVKEALFPSIIENAVGVENLYNKDSFQIFITSLIDDLLIRYIEFKEWYAERPDKIKHLDYIMNEISNGNDKKLFLDKLHFYTDFPEIASNKTTRKSGLIYRMKDYYSKVKSTPLNKLPKKVLLRIFRR